MTDELEKPKEGRTLINYKLDNLQESINHINKKLEDQGDGGFVGRREFNALSQRVGEKADKRELSNVTKIVYGAVGLILIGFGTVIINFFLRPSR